jgi:hypothetical protein
VLLVDNRSCLERILDTAQFRDRAFHWASLPGEPPCRKLDWDRMQYRLLSSNLTARIEQGSNSTAQPIPRPNLRLNAKLVPEVVGYDTAVLGELAHDGVVESDVLLGATVLARVDTKFLRQFFPRAYVGIKIQQL